MFLGQRQARLGRGSPGERGDRILRGRRKASYRKRSRRQRTLPGTKSKFQLVSWKVVIMAMKRAWKLYPWTLESGAKARCLPRVMRGKRVIQES